MLLEEFDFIISYILIAKHLVLWFKDITFKVNKTFVLFGKEKTLEIIQFHEKYYIINFWFTEDSPYFPKLFWGVLEYIST